MSPETAITPVAPGPLTARGHRGWSRAELDVLTDHYAQGGALACAPYLPHRPRTTSASPPPGWGCAITTATGASRPATTAPTPPSASFTPTASPRPAPSMNSPSACNGPANGCASGPLSGAIRYIRGRNWTDPEDAILMAREGQGPRAIQKRLIAAGYTDRSEAAIGERCRRLGLCAILDRADSYSANNVATLLGQDIRVVLRWLQAQRLPARAQRDAQGGRSLGASPVSTCGNS